MQAGLVVVVVKPSRRGSKSGCPVDVLGVGEGIRTVELPKAVSESSKNDFDKDLEWLVERHAIADPFEVKRAEKVSHTLQNYASELFRALQLNEIPSSDSNPRHVLLEVHEIPGAPSYFRRVHWEALEDINFYSNGASNLSGLTVRHVISSSPPLANGDSKLTNGSFHPEHEDSKLDHGLRDVDRPRVLAVTARKPGDVRDIPHRSITRPILETMKVLGRVKDLDVLRPPTFDQLKAQLRFMGPGYYHVVHLDVHGVIRDSKPKLCFVESDGASGSVKWKVDEIPAEEVGRLLNEWKVNIVVLNACESAKEGDDPNLNLARSFIQMPNIDTIVAMSYKLLETSASLFMQAFYYQLFQHRSHAIFSAKFGREQLMRTPGRKTDFSTEVAVHDYFVPIIYEAQSVFENSNELDALQLSLTSSANSLREYDLWLHQTEDKRPTVVGREFDLLMLEMDLYQYVADWKTDANGKKIKTLESGGIRRIEGEAGVGKSALLAEAIQWWRDTGFIDDQVIFFSHLDSVVEDLATFVGVEFAKQDSDRKRWAKLKQKLRQRLEAAKKNKRPFLFVFDETASKEDGDLLKDAPSLRNMFLQSESLVIIASRTTKLWHGGLTTHVRTLDPLNRDNSIKLGFEFLKESGALKAAETSPENLDAVSNIIKLASGNPLALRILMQNFSMLKLFEAPQDYFMHLMRGHRIRIHQSWWEKDGHGSSNSVKELKAALGKDISPLVHLLLPFWLKIPNFALPDSELQIYCWWYVEACWMGEEDQEEATPAPSENFPWNLWGTMPDVLDKATQRTVSLMLSESTNFPSSATDSSESAKTTESDLKSNHSAAEDTIDDFDISESDSDLDEYAANDDESNEKPFKPTVPPPRTSYIDTVIKKADPTGKYYKFWGEKLEVSKERYAAFASCWNSLEATCKKLEKLGFFIKDGSKETDAKYLRLHPLVPLVLRQLSSTVSREVCRQLYPRFIGYKIKTWPLDKLHADKAWTEKAHAVAGAEFINLLAAAYFIVEPHPVRGRLNLVGNGKSRGPDEAAEYFRFAELIRLSLALQKGILGDRTRQTVVAWFWEEARWQFQSEIKALKRITPSQQKKASKNWSNGVREFRESLSGSGTPTDLARRLLFALEVTIILAGVTFRVTQFWWNLAVIAYSLRNMTAETLLLSLWELALSAYGAVREHIRRMMMTNSKAPVKSLLMEVISMLYICGLFNYYDGIDQRKMEFYVIEAKLLTKERTRIPVLDIAVSCVFGFVAQMLAKFLRPSTKEDIMELLSMRQTFFNGLSRLGYDTAPYTKRRALPGLPPELGGMLDLRNSLSKPVEAALKAHAESQAVMSKPGGGPRAMQLLRDALNRELHDKSEGIGEGRGPSGGGAIPYNVAYLYRSLSEVAERDGDYVQAVGAWEEALKWEAKGEFTKSRQRESKDLGTLQRLREMAELEKERINGAAAEGDKLFDVDEEE